MIKKNPSIKNPETYRALRRKGESKEKSARISNAQVSNNTDVDHSGYKALPYTERSKKVLYKQAQELGIAGRSKMSKAELITAIKHH